MAFRRASLNIMLQVLLVHGRRAELERLVDRGLNMRHHSYGGYSNFFTGGLQHILEDNVLHYIALNQLLLHGWTPAECQNWHGALEGAGTLSGGVSAKAAQHYWTSRCVEGLPVKLRLKHIISRILVQMCDVHDYRLNKEGAVYSAFRCEPETERCALCRNRVIHLLVVKSVYFFRFLAVLTVNWSTG